jgi:hypothetical protein
VRIDVIIVGRALACATLQRRRTRNWKCPLAGVLLTKAIIFAQETPATIRVTGAVKQQLTLTAEDLAKMPRASAKLTHEGIETTYEGVWLHEVLGRAGAPQGSALRGKALAGYVLAQGAGRLSGGVLTRRVGSLLYR